MSVIADDALTLDDVDEALRHAWATGDRAYIDRLLDTRLTLHA
jgi:hypothetical protein